MRRLRVLHVIDSLAGSGGAENRLVDEVVALSDRFDQTVVRLFERDFLDRRLVAAAVPVVALGFTAHRAGWSWPLLGRRLARVARELRPDVIHTSLFTGNLVGQRAGTRLGVPVVSTFNRTGDLALQRALQPGVATWRGRLMQAVGRRAARRDGVHYRAVGAYARDTNCALMRLPVDAATVVPRGVALDDLAGVVAGRAAFGLPEGVPLFVNSARLVAEKAQHLLVEAFAHVHCDLPDARWSCGRSSIPATRSLRSSASPSMASAATAALVPRHRSPTDRRHNDGCSAPSTGPGRYRARRSRRRATAAACGTCPRPTCSLPSAAVLGCRRR